MIGLILKGINVTSQFIALDGNSYETLQAAKDKGVATLTYGNFLQATIDFLAIAFVLFLIVRQANKLKKPAVPAA